ncbi:PadR family transcriptional regulator [Cellulomonas sp. PhB150]|uniref:PadR family transcriptional regulator n=1 Tax=Cellulomonas sp. PhB150 TaxID=2485188 RepID=UPI000F463596|nr:PadR family transcriptional regulator [Cellulomonas sp. PhB150]ROS27797.1 PadR family transcriptional regulator [Cellulomonas sp. PhB150]
MAPVFAHGQLRLYLLALLESGPKHGYELITALSARFDGTYRPSAGTIYPRLSRLEDEGLVTRTDEERKSTYALTDAGRVELEARRDELTHLEAGISETVRDRAFQVRDDVRGSMRGLRKDLEEQARQARAAAKPGHDPSSDARRDSHARWAEADGLVTRFRDELRADLKRASAHGRVDAETVEQVRRALDDARRALRDTLR